MRPPEFNEGERALTAPASSRGRPPGPPPAPPGMPGDRNRGNSDDGVEALARVLESCLQDVATLHVGLESIALFPADPEIRAELSGVIDGAVRDALRKLSSFRHDVLPQLAETSLAAWRTSMLALIHRGIRSNLLPSTLGETVPGCRLIRYSYASPPHIARLDDLPPTRLAHLLIRDLETEFEAVSTDVPAETAYGQLRVKVPLMLFACLCHSAWPLPDNLSG